jgi:hypothetical protein
MDTTKLLIKDFEVGMIVITPNDIHPGLTAHRRYVIEDVAEDWIKILDDTDESRYYQSFLFIEPDVYYTITMFMTMTRLLECYPDLNP